MKKIREAIRRIKEAFIRLKDFLYYKFSRKYDKRDKMTIWYEKRVNDVLSDNEDADESYDILLKIKELGVYDIIREKQKEKKEIKWDVVLKAASLILGLMFNVFLCGCIFRYETFAPIITRCFGFIKPMSI